MDERMECAECGVDKRRVNLELTDDEEYLCERCFKERLEEEAQGMGVSLGRVLALVGGFAAVSALIVGVVKGPEWYLESAEASFRDCLYARPGQGKKPPSECLQEIESVEWMRQIPTVPDGIDGIIDSARVRVCGSQVRYVSSVEPSAEARGQALERCDQLVDEIDGASPYLGGSSGFLSGIDDSLADGRAEYADWIVKGTSDGQFRIAVDLVGITGDAKLRDWAVDRALDYYVEGDQRCSTCSALFDVATLACIGGRPKAGQRLTSRYEEVVQNKESYAPIQEQLRQADALQNLCGETEESGGEKVGLTKWWAHGAGRKLVEDVFFPGDLSFRVALSAQRVAREEVKREDVAEMMGVVGESPGPYDPIEDEKTLESEIDRSISRVSGSLESPKQVLGHRVIVRPSVDRRAAEALQAQYDLDEAVWARKFRRAFQLSAVAARAKLGDRQGAFDALTRLSGVDEQRRRRIQAVLFRLFGKPAKAARIWKELQDGSEPSLDLRLREARALAGARNFDAAREVVAQTDLDASSELASEFVSLAYAVAMYGKPSPDEALDQMLPARFQPDEVETSSLDDRLTKYLYHLYELNTASESTRKQLRSRAKERPVRHARKLWYRAAIAGSVEPRYDAEVWLDYTTERSTEGFSERGPWTRWTRAEVARWRGDDEAAEAWMARVFPDESLVDDTRSWLLYVLLMD